MSLRKNRGKQEADPCYLLQTWVEWFRLFYHPDLVLDEIFPDIYAESTQYLIDRQISDFDDDFHQAVEEDFLKRWIEWWENNRDSYFAGIKSPKIYYLTFLYFYAG